MIFMNTAYIVNYLQLRYILYDVFDSDEDNDDDDDDVNVVDSVYVQQC